MATAVLPGPRSLPPIDTAMLKMPDAARSRFVIEKVELLHESEGPDYFTSGEFRVTDTATGEIVARFPWSLEEA